MHESHDSEFREQKETVSQKRRRESLAIVFHELGPRSRRMASGKFRLYGEHVGLSLGGVGVLATMILLSLVFVGYDADWLKKVKDSESARTALPQLSSFLAALRNETAIRSAVTINTAAAAAAHLATASTYTSLRSALATRISSAALTSMDALLNAYVTTSAQSASQVSILSAHLALSNSASDALFMYFRSGLDNRPAAIIDSLAMQQVMFRYTSAASQAALLYRSKLSGDFSTSEQLGQVARSLEALKNSLTYAPTVPIPLTFVSVIGSMIASAYSVATTIPTATKVATLNSAVSASASAESYLKGLAATSIPDLSSDVTKRVVVFAVGAGFAFVAFLVCAFIVVRHIISTKRGRLLLIAFRDPDASRIMIETYNPVLQHLRVIGPLPLKARNDVEKEYHVASKLMLQLRPHLPQALFGDLNSRHKRKPNGAWDIACQSMRLEMSMAFCHCTVLTIAINSYSINHGTRDDVAAVLSEASMAFNAVVEEVNHAGGIVTGLGAGGRISCVWNATHVIDDPAFVAVKTARIIDKRLGSMNIGRDLNISTGSCIVANSKIGSRKHVTYIGGAFDVAEKLLLLNEGHVARLILDFETYKDLPRDQQRTCKPIAVITEKDEPPIVVMSADEDDALRGDQWKQYNTAFTLYQNNMLSESLGEFRKYLQNHPGDPCATWLIENVLEPKIGRRKSAMPLMMGR